MKMPFLRNLVMKSNHQKTFLAIYDTFLVKMGYFSVFSIY